MEEPRGVIPSGAVLQAKREPALSEVEGDLPRIDTGRAQPRSQLTREGGELALARSSGRARVLLVPLNPPKPDRASAPEVRSPGSLSAASRRTHRSPEGTSATTPKTVKDLSGRNVKDVLGLDKTARRTEHPLFWSCRQNQKPGHPARPPGACPNSWDTARWIISLRGGGRHRTQLLEWI